MAINQIVWLVGQTRENEEWEIQGIFFSEGAALNVIEGYESENHFIAPIQVNSPWTEKTCDPLDGWYPKLECKPESLKINQGKTKA